MARTMLAEYNTPLMWWAEAINTACHIVNRVYLHKFFNKTSYELMVGKKPNVSYFKLFGAPCWIRDPHHQSKFSPKACEGFMLGYGINSHTYCQNPLLGNVLGSKSPCIHQRKSNGIQI